MLKQVLVVRKDLKMSKGKLAVQCAHASLGVYKKINKSVVKKWSLGGEKKVIVCVETLKDLIERKKRADKLNMPNYLVRDAGRTELRPGTKTVLGIGPDEQVDKVTGSLPLLK